MRRLVGAVTNPRVPKSCDECATQAAAGQWNRAERCRPCIWREFDEWERQIYALWLLVATGEGWMHHETKQRRVRFSVDTVLYQEMRMTAHPAFGSPAVEPWEVLRCLKELAAFLSDDPYTQMEYGR